MGDRADDDGLLDERPESALTVLVETDLVGALAEALTADVEAVLSDDTTLVGADTAMVEKLNEMQCGQYETLKQSNRSTEQGADGLSMEQHREQCRLVAHCERRLACIHSGCAGTRSRPTPEQCFKTSPVAGAPLLCR